MAEAQQAQEHIKEINAGPLVIGEGQKHYDSAAVPKIKAIMSQYRSIDDLIKNASLKEKMQIASYLNTGKWCEVSDNWITNADKTANILNGQVHAILEPYVGIDTRRLVTKTFGIGWQIDIVALEEKIDRDLYNWLSDSVGGRYWKAGKVFQSFQGFYKSGKSQSRYNAGKTAKSKKGRTRTTPGSLGSTR